MNFYAVYNMEGDAFLEFVEIRVNSGAKQYEWYQVESPLHTYPLDGVLYRLGYYQGTQIPASKYAGFLLVPVFCNKNTGENDYNWDDAMVVSELFSNGM